MSKLRQIIKQFNRRRALWVIMALLPFSMVSPALTSKADTTPPSGTPATVSADALPTVQIDGVVWAQAVVGNTVYATGRFDTARPAGAAPGHSTVPRHGLVAYNITTGKLDTKFVHSLGGSSSGACTGTQATGPQGCSIAASPDGSMLYVGGTFTKVDGKAHANVVAINLHTNQVVSGFQGVNNMVRAVTATNTGVYLGGSFSKAGGHARQHLAMFNKSGSLNTRWNGSCNGLINGMVVAKNKLIIAGSFTKASGAKRWSNAALSLTTGAAISPWASSKDSFPIHAVDPEGHYRTALTSASTDGTKVYLTSFTFIGPAEERLHTFEGRMAISATDGSFLWLNDCVGDSYDAFPMGKVLYSASHIHGCAPLGYAPNYPHHHVTRRATAETTYKTGINNGHNVSGYPSYNGKPAGSILHWFPDFTAGTYTGVYQAAWSVTGNTRYLSYGGEFTAVNGQPQQGLVRFALKSIAPNNVGPKAYGSSPATAATAVDSRGKSTVSVAATTDEDNAELTYKLYRQGRSKPIATKKVSSAFWHKPVWTVTDSGLQHGHTYAYRVVVSDPYGNTTSSSFQKRTMSPISLRYKTDALFARLMGKPTAGEVNKGSMRYRVYQHGRAYWSTDTDGVYYISGGVLSYFLKHGGVDKFGVPSTDQVTDHQVAKGFYNHFRKGKRQATIYWQRQYGAHDIGGAIRTKWLASGGSSGPCRFPISAETKVHGGKAYYNIMTNNCAIYWSSSTGAHFVQGAIYSKWKRLGAADANIGLPTSDVVKASGGYKSNFQKGVIYWSSSTGAHYVAGGILSKYKSIGAERSRLGFPTSDQKTTSYGWRSNFKHGFITYHRSTHRAYVHYT